MRARRDYRYDYGNSLPTIRSVALHAALIFGCCIVDYNIGSLRAFLKNGYRIEDRIELLEESKADYELDVVISREEYFGG